MLRQADQNYKQCASNCPLVYAPTACVQACFNGWVQETRWGEAPVRLSSLESAPPVVAAAAPLPDAGFWHRPLKST